ncbi:MAG: polyferredoxin [Akkermansiaceae bacterium]|jgi:polyferredoxin
MLPRRIFAVVLLVVYVALPWITINDASAVFLDVANRQFHFLGITLAPQDLWVLFFAITGAGFPPLFFCPSRPVLPLLLRQVRAKILEAAAMAKSSLFAR